MDIDWLGILALLLGLELVLGVDNVLVIAILVARLPEHLRARARFIGLALAMVARIVLLFVALWLAGLDRKTLVGSFTARDMLLMVGGLFLLWKAVKEIHHVVELKDEAHPGGSSVQTSYRSAILQIVALDLVFSVDSVLTAIGLTQSVWIIITAVTLSFVAVLFFANPIGEFILAHPALKILALAFLITIGVTIFLEGMHQHVRKAYIYLPMGFALGVELLQMRYQRNRERRPGGPSGAGDEKAKRGNPSTDTEAGPRSGST